VTTEKDLVRLAQRRALPGSAKAHRAVRGDARVRRCGALAKIRGRSVVQGAREKKSVSGGD
jgi:hypothetical protein